MLMFQTQKLGRNVSTPNPEQSLITNVTLTKVNMIQETSIISQEIYIL